MTELNLTKYQGLVFAALNEKGAPLSAYSILDHLRGEGFRAPLQVYRALDKLVEQGLVHRLESLNAFVACSHDGCTASEAAVFAICETCGQVSEFADDKLSRQVAARARSDGFQVNKTTIELRGECHDCAAA